VVVSKWGKKPFGKHPMVLKRGFIYLVKKAQQMIVKIKFAIINISLILLFFSNVYVKAAT